VSRLAQEPPVLERRGDRAPLLGLVAALLLVAAAVVVPLASGWDVHPRDDDRGFAPTHGIWDPGLGVGTPFALALALAGVRWGPALAQRLPWGRLLWVTGAAAAAWMLALALVDGPSGLTRALGNRWEYLPTAREVGSVPELLATYTARIPYSAAPDNWVTHVAGHPPGALLFFVGLVRLGLGGDLAAGLVVTVLAATTAPAVLVALRALGAPSAARTAAPLLALSPAAVYLCVSADAVFTATAAWGLAALALATRARRGAALAGWSVLAGLLLGTCVTFSYGLPLLGTLCLAVLAAGRRWSPLPVAAAAALVPVALLASGGYLLWEAYPVLVERYWDGIASRRPAAYWSWGNLAALVVCAGPVVGAGLAALRGRSDWSNGPEAGERRVVVLLVAGAVGFVLLASLSQMSKGEVERIWLPLVPWLSLALLALPRRWARWGTGLQVAWALLVQHLLYTSW
jgi:methylthioxylose transferase